MFRRGEFAEIYSLVGTRAINDVFVREMIEYRKASPGLPLQQPWMAIAECRYHALALSAEQEIVDFRSAEQNRAACAQAFLEARAFLWRSEIHDIAKEFPLPPHIVADPCLPFDTCYFCWDRDLTLPDGLTHQGTLLQRAEGALLIVEVLHDKTAGRLVFEPTGIEFGQRWPEDLHGSENPLSSHAHALRLIAFLNSRVVVNTAVRAPRAMLHRAKRAGTPVPNDESFCNVIDLRAEDRAAPSDGAGEERAYRHRWWVRGHIRAQWMPSLKGHRLVYIAPHIKGPVDAPFVDQVYDVRR